MGAHFCAGGERVCAQCSAAPEHGAFSSPGKIRMAFGGNPARGRMENVTRLEVLLPVARRAALDALADEYGLSSSTLARLAIGRLLQTREVLLKPDATERAA
jgi:hypothetical protein